MTIWILALILLVGGAAVGYSQGAVRVGVSLIGLVTGALAAFPLGQLTRRVLPPLGLENPLLIWLLGPLIAFLFILVVFKMAGFFVHKKIDLYYRYKAGDLRRKIWERLNRRLGLCLSFANSAVYLVLICLPIYPTGYLITQIASGDADSKALRLLDKAGADLQATGLAKAVAAIEPVPTVFYDVSDLVGLIYQNPLLLGRLSRYPAFLTFSDRPEFRDIASDRDYGGLWLRQAPFMEILDNPKTQAILKNKQLVAEVWDRAQPELGDLRTYLETGRSPKFEREKILGRWVFDKNESIGTLKRTRSNLTSSILRFLRQAYYPALARTTFMATPEKQAFLRDLARLRPAANPFAAPGRRPLPSQPAGAVTEPLSLEGQWKKNGGNYELSLSEQGKSANPQESVKREVTFEGEKMIITGEAVPLVFQRE